MKYSPKCFKESMPKGKKSSILVKLFYRPCSYIISSIVSQFGITANTVSIFSVIVAIVGSICFISKEFVVQIIGAILVNVWLILDCVDGNIARTIKKQPFGKFADGISSYILVGLLFNCIGFATYFKGGVIFPKKCAWMILFGALASSSDTLMRLIYQKYKNTEIDMIKEGVINAPEAGRDDKNKYTLKDKIEMELGIGGILPLAILICTIFNALDIVVLYSFLYYTLSFLAVVTLYILKVIKYSKLGGKEK